MFNVDKVEQFVKLELGTDSTGHGWDHAKRVYRLAMFIRGQEGGDLDVIVAAALVHDVIDPKLFADLDLQREKVCGCLQAAGLSGSQQDDVFEIIENMSFKGGHGQKLGTIEGQIVQDADRLDAIGAIGIGRTFMYGGARGTKMYDECLPVAGGLEVMS